MKIIFLDIDGVLNCMPRPFGLNPELVNNLKMILDETDAKIVVSSSWRLYADEPNVGLGIEWRKVLADMLGRNTDIFIGDTPDYFNSKNFNNWERASRGNEIEIWLQKNSHRFKDLKCVVVDDEISDIISTINKKYVFKTDIKYGLTKDIAEKIIECLNDKI